MSGRLDEIRNPWRFGIATVDVLDEMCRLGNQTEVAARLRITSHGVNMTICRATARMGTRNNMMTVLQWDRWRQGEGKGVPA
jgi:hypothetical protein